MKMITNTIKMALPCLALLATSMSAQDFPSADIFYGTAVTDGVVEAAWDSVPANALTVDLDGSAPEASNLSGYWKAMWDADNLYLLVVTTDDVTTAYPGSQFWNYDITEIFVDADHSAGTTYDGVNDAQLVFPRDGTAPFESSPLVITFTDYGLVQGSGMVVQEIALPWSELAVSPSIGAQLGLDVYMKDNDSDPLAAARENQISWSPSADQAWNNPSLFGTVTLSGPSAVIPYGMAVADGAIDRIWGLVPANPLTVDLDGSAPEASNLSGYWKAMWDEDNLYLLVETTDNTTTAYPGSQFWNYDMTEIFIDTDHSRGNSYDGANDAQLVFPRDGSAPFESSPLDITFTDYGIVQGAGKVVQEVAIPWSELAATPSLGAQLGLDVYMKDNDSDPLAAARENQISWSPSGDQAWNNASLFGTVTLGEPVLPQAVIPMGTATMDGTIERIWNVVDANPLTVDLDNTSPEASNLSGYWKAMWDADNLYLLVVTTDDVTTAYPGSQFWNYDMTEIFIDADHSRGNSYDGVNDAQLVFPRDGSAPFESSPLDITFTDYGIVQGTGKVIQEIALPWSELAVSPSLGAQLGLDVYMKDNDSDPLAAARDNQISWSPSGDQAWNNASVFGTITLGASALPYASAPMATINVDGELDAMWDNVTPQYLEVDLDGTSPSADNLSGYWKAIWDADNLYVLVVTTDDTTTAYPGSEFWNYDVTEVFVDGDHSRGTSYDGVNDAQLVFPRDGTTPFEGSPLNITFTDYVLVQGTGMVIQEIALPWSELAVAPSLGAHLGLDVYLKDNDSDPLAAARVNQISWSPSQDQAWNDASLFGAVQLSGSPLELTTFAVAVEAQATDSKLVSPWFGSFIVSGSDWVYHDQLGWNYVGHVTDSNNLWLWSDMMNQWTYTNKDWFPLLYGFGPEAGWYFYFYMEGIGAFLYDYNSATWLAIP